MAGRGRRRLVAVAVPFHAIVSTIDTILFLGVHRSVKLQNAVVDTS